MKHENSVRSAAAVSIIALTGCATAPEMAPPSSYASMSCAELRQEVGSVEKNAERAEPSLLGGFLLAALAGVASARGADQSAATNLVSSHAQSMDASEKEAGALRERAGLLRRLAAAKGC